MNTEHIDVGADFSDAQVAEIFLHHRVLIVPVVDERRVVGVITARTSSARWRSGSWRADRQIARHSALAARARSSAAALSH